MGMTLLSDPFWQALAAIDRLSELEPGWDSYDASPVEESARTSAKEFLRSVERSYGPSVTDGLNVGPTPDGGVALVWRYRSTDVEALLGTANGPGRYVVTKGKKLVAEGWIPEPGWFAKEVLKRHLAS